MLWTEAISLLAPSTIVILQKHDRADYYFAEKLGVHDKSLSSDIIYFAVLSELCSGLPALEAGAPDTPLSVILYCDLPEVPRALYDRFDHIACVGNEAAYYDAWHTLLRAFRQSFRLNHSLQRLTELVATENDLNAIAQWISDFYRHPVGIYDNSFSVVAHSATEDFRILDSPDLLNDIETGYISMDVIRQVQAEQDASYFRKKSSKPVLVRHTYGQFKHYSTPVLIGATTAGFFSVFLKPGEELDPLELMYLEKVAKQISIVMQRNNFYANNKAHFYASFFASMLEGTAEAARNWESRLSAYGYTLRPSMRVIVAGCPKFGKSRLELGNLASSLHHIFRGSIYYIQENLIVLFCSTTPEEFSTSYIRNQGDDFFVRNSLRIGISSEFHSIYDMKTHYQEAKTAVELGGLFAPKEHFFLYDNLRLFDIVYRLSECSDISSFCYPPFMALFQYDLEHGTQLGPTLYSYILDPKRPAEVCRKLNIHKNTLYFRLEKAGAIMNADYHQLSVMTQIYLTVIILRFTRQINTEIYDFSLLPSAGKITEETSGG